MFFTKHSNEDVRIVLAADGFIAENAFANESCVLPYERILFGDRWLLVTGRERALIDRLVASCTPLGHVANTSNIFVGLQTSADNIYHLTKIGPSRYISSASGDSYEVELEDALMKPLVSGIDAKRFQIPSPSTFLLFPYRVNERADLISSERMISEFPLAWRYLSQWEDRLRKREADLDETTGDFVRDGGGLPVHAPFNDESWYRFGRSQNLDKQELPKLIVPRLVARLSCSIDAQGTFYLDNVDVGGVHAADGVDLFLARWAF